MRIVLLLLAALNAFAAGRELAPRGAAPTSYPANTPHVAFAGERFLTVWTEDMGSVGLHLMGAFSDARGRRVTPIAFPVERAFRGQVLQLVGTGDSYALFWKDSDSTFLSDIDATGRITRTTALAIPKHIDLRVAFNGARFFAALRHPVGPTHDAEGILLARSGEVLRRDLPIDDEAYAFDAIANGDGFAAATSGFRGVFAYRITGDGDVTSYAIDDTASDIALVSTTADGGLLVVRGATRELELRANVVTASGDVLPRQVLATATQPPRVVHVRRVDGAHLISYLLVSHLQSGIATVTLHADGSIARSPHLAGEFPPSTLIPLVTAASPEATLAVFAQPGIYPAPLMSLAVANDRVASVPEPVSVSRSRQSQPILAGGGGRVLAAWSDIQGYAAYVRTSSLAPDATPLTDTIAAPAYVAARELPWNGSEYLIVQSRFDNLLATRVAHDGTPLDAEPFRLGQHSGPWWELNAAAVWAGDRWMVAWEHLHDIYFSTIRNGVASPAKKLELRGILARDPALSFDGTTLLAVWTEQTPPECWFFPPCGDLWEDRGYAARITTEGKLADGKRIAIPAAANYSIATSGDEFFVLGGSTATTIDASGPLRIIESRSIFDWPAAGDVAWDGSSYAVALRYAGLRWYVGVTHFDRDLDVVGTPRGTLTLPPDHFVAPSIAAGIVAVQEGDAAEGARAVVYREADLQPLPPPPPTPLNVRATPTADRMFEITWDESPGAELYRVTVFGSSRSSVWQVIDVPADQPRRAIAYTPDIRVTAFNAGGASDPLPRRRNVRR